MLYVCILVCVCQYMCAPILTAAQCLRKVDRTFVERPETQLFTVFEPIVRRKVESLANNKLKKVSAVVERGLQLSHTAPVSYTHSTLPTLYSVSIQIVLVHL